MEIAEGYGGRYIRFNHSGLNAPVVLGYESRGTGGDPQPVPVPRKQSSACSAAGVLASSRLAGRSGEGRDLRCRERRQRSNSGLRCSGCTRPAPRRPSLSEVPSWRAWRASQDRLRQDAAAGWGRCVPTICGGVLLCLTSSEQRVSTRNCGSCSRYWGCLRHELAVLGGFGSRRIPIEPRYGAAARGLAPAVVRGHALRLPARQPTCRSRREAGTRWPQAGCRIPT